ncbi:MAG: histidine phosphatase family protein, partial [Patescibacteria group bacterium]
GKTTTTAMVAKLLEDAGLDPTVLLGAIVPKWKTNYRIGESKYFVVEADEFYDNFLSFHPDISVVTNIEMDHPEYFKDFASYKKSFEKFKSQSKKVFDKPKGKFNAANASLASQVGQALGIDAEIIRKSSAGFTGVSRRFEYIGEYNGAKVYSDFGHHPTEIKVTMEAAREKFPGQRILLIYQPHMFTRTKALFDDFVKVLKNSPADKTFVMDIYPSREKDLGLTSSKQLVDSINKASVQYIGNTDETLKKLKPEIKPEDIIFFMSAGDTDKLARELVDQTYCTIYIVRHGQTDWNVKRLIQGESDIPINCAGKKQAEDLRSFFNGINIDAVFSSDLIRAKKTAEIITLNRKLTIKTTKLLRERRYGKFDGKTWEETKEIFETWDKLDEKGRLTFRPAKDYETDEETIGRFITFLRETAAVYPGKTVLIVSHGSIMRIALNHLSGENFLTGAISNSAYIKLKSDGVDFFIEDLVGIKKPNEK